MLIINYDSHSNKKFWWFDKKKLSKSSCSLTKIPFKLVLVTSKSLNKKNSNLNPINFISRYDVCLFYFLTCLMPDDLPIT